MNEPTPPRGENVPDAVLDELTAAFADQTPGTLDLDDPAIDRMLGLAGEPEEQPPTEPLDHRRRHRGDSQSRDEDGRGESTDAAPAPAPAGRPTIVIGGDDSIGVQTVDSVGGSRRSRRRAAYLAEKGAAAAKRSAGLVTAEERAKALAVATESAPVAAKTGKTAKALRAPKPARAPESDQEVPAPRPSRAERKRAKAALEIGTTDRDGRRRIVAVEPRHGRGTILIGGDDLPDAVFLDEAGEDRLREVHVRTGSEPGAARNTIQIGDELDSTGMFDAVPVHNASMDPRVRARRIAVKRAEGRRRLLWTAVVAAVVLVAVAILAVFSSTIFAVDRVDVQGNVYTNPEALAAIEDSIKGEPILLVDTQEAERRLEAIPWVERARVSTDFPHRVFIDIRERVPLAVYRGADGRYRVIDRDGRVLDILGGRPVDYLVIDGAGPDTDAGAFAGTPYARAAQLAGSLPEEIRTIARSLTLDPGTGDLGMILANPDSVGSGDVTTTTVADDVGGSTIPERTITVRLGSASGLDRKLARLLHEIRGDVSGVIALDVSTDDVAKTSG